MQSDQLVAEFQRITEEYNGLREAYDRTVAALLQRRREIVQELIDNNGAPNRRTHRQVGEMLALSGGRVGQLVKGAPGYVPQRLSKEA